MVIFLVQYWSCLPVGSGGYEKALVHWSRVRQRRLEAPNSLRQNHSSMGWLGTSQCPASTPTSLHGEHIRSISCGEITKHSKRNLISPTEINTGSGWCDQSSISILSRKGYSSIFGWFDCWQYSRIIHFFNRSKNPCVTTSCTIKVKTNVSFNYTYDLIIISSNLSFNARSDESAKSLKLNWL